MRLASVLLALTIAAAAGEAVAGAPLAIGLRVPSAVACGESGCLRIVPGRYHPATIAGAAPVAADREACAAGFLRLVADLSDGRSIGRRALYKARRCRSLGLAPVIVPG